jgi:hypothetical protein
LVKNRRVSVIITVNGELQSKKEGEKLRVGGTATKANERDVPENNIEIDDNATEISTTAINEVWYHFGVSKTTRNGD